MKALFLDLDGTLLDDNKNISEKNRKAIFAALEHGHKIIINTGRPSKSALMQSEKLGLTKKGCYVSAYNGAEILDAETKKCVFKKAIPLDIVYALFAEANKRKIHVQTYEDENVLVEPACDDEAIQLYTKTINVTYRVIDKIADLTVAPSKVLLVSFDNHDALINFMQFVRDNYDDQLDTFFSSSSLLEIVSKGVNKGSALLNLADIFGIPVENTYSMGDDENDIAMIKAAGTGIAMINGKDNVKAAADMITINDNNHDAVAEIIYSLIL